MQSMQGDGHGDCGFILVVAAALVAAFVSSKVAAVVAVVMCHSDMVIVACRGWQCVELVVAVVVVVLVLVEAAVYNSRVLITHSWYVQLSDLCARRIL